MIAELGTCCCYCLQVVWQGQLPPPLLLLPLPELLLLFLLLLLVLLQHVMGCF